MIRGNLAEDLKRLCVEAERIGVGSPEMRMKVMDNMEVLDFICEETERQQLGLSRYGRMIFAKRESGHAVILQDLEIVMTELAWVIEESTKRRERILVFTYIC